MTQDKIIEMARQFASHGVEDQRSGEVSFVFYREHLINFVNLIAGIAVRESSMEYRLGWNDGQIHEREECAKLCDSTVEQTYISGYTGAVHSGRRECAEAIRARNLD